MFIFDWDALGSQSHEPMPNLCIDQHLFGATVVQRHTPKTGPQKGRSALSKMPRVRWSNSSGITRLKEYLSKALHKRLRALIWKRN
jgi:hypothetical protein